MASILGLLGGAGLDVLTGGLSSLISAGANAINQKIEFGFNQQLQQNSFTHDKQMLAAQVEATKKLQAEMIAIRQHALEQGGFTPTDAARGAVGAPMTKLVDWNGTRYWAPGAQRTTSYSGTYTGMAPRPSYREQVVAQKAAPPPRRSDGITTMPNGLKHASVQAVTGNATFATPNQLGSLRSSSWGQPQASNSTQSTSLPSSSASSSSDTLSRAATRTQQWVNDQQRSVRQLQPFHRDALRTTWVTPPASEDTRSVASTENLLTLQSWTPAFNTQRQPLFAHLRRRGESQV